MTLAEDVRRGLAERPYRIPSVHFYDATGSALFEEITKQPEYYLTETERGILRAHAPEIVRAADAGSCLVELGAGSASKTRVLMDALLERHVDLEYVPIDVSEAALAEAEGAVRKAYGDRVRVQPVLARNREGLRALPNGDAAPRLVLFLGSSIGNFDMTEATRFLADVRAALRPKDRLLLGTDMLKDESVLVPAYFDAAGVTTRFNLNLLARVNRELDADFDLDAWEHKAVFNREESRMESHLIARRDMTVHVRALELEVPFRAGEGIHTECSYKYTNEMVTRLVRESGFTMERSWFDRKRWFGLHLLAPG